MKERLASSALGCVIASSAVLFVVLLSGCANVNLTDAERIACRNEAAGCSAWTEAELLLLVGKAAGAGYEKGWRDANTQAGRNL